MGYYSNITFSDLKITFPYEKVEEEPVEVDETLAALKEQAEAHGLIIVDAKANIVPQAEQLAKDFFDTLNDDEYDNLNFALNIGYEENEIFFERTGDTGKLYDLEHELSTLAKSVTDAGGFITGELHRSGEENGDLERYYFVDNKLKTEGVKIVWENTGLPVNI